MIKLMDCTLRDGGNVVGKGFNEGITKIVLELLVKSGTDYIEFGNARVESEHMKWLVSPKHSRMTSI